MPSTRRQKAKSRKSRELDMLSDYGNMDVMLGGRSSNSTERELDSLINVPEGQRDFQSFPNRENSSQENEIRDIDSRNEPVRESRLIETIKSLSGEMNARMSREMEAMMDLMQSQISRAISSAISERIIPEIQNMVENLPLSQHGVEPCTSADEDGIGNVWKNANAKLTKKDSRSACDLRDHTDVSPYMVTGATELQQPIPEFLTGRIHSQPDLQRQESTHDTTLDTTLPITEPVPAEQPLDPINRLTDVLVNLQNKPQSMTIRPVTTNPMTFDGKTEKFELFEDLFHTMIKMQPAMTEQMKINHFHSLLRKGALQTFRNINSINRQTLEDVMVIFRRKYVKPESQATAKHILPSKLEILFLLDTGASISVLNLPTFHVISKQLNINVPTNLQNKRAKTLTVANQTEVPIIYYISMTCFTEVNHKTRSFNIDFAVANIKYNILGTPFSKNTSKILIFNRIL